MIGRYETQQCTIPVAGRTVLLLGPRHPHSLRRNRDVEERFLADGYMHYWATPWPAALMLADYLVRNVEPPPIPVLEIGAGLGLVGISLALAGYRMVVTDYDDDALDFVRASARLNAVELHDVRPLDWRYPPAAGFAMILAGDALYEKRNLAPISGLISSCLLPGGTAYVSAQRRSPVEAFPAALAEAGLSRESIPLQCRAIPFPDALDGRTLRGTLFCITHCHV